MENTSGGKRLLWTRWFTLICAVIAIALIGWYTILVAVELRTESALTSTITLQLGNDGSTGHVDKYGGLLDQLSEQLGANLIIDWESIDIDENKWRARRVTEMDSVIHEIMGVGSTFPHNLPIMDTTTTPRSYYLMTRSVTLSRIRFQSHQLHLNEQFQYSVQLDRPLDWLMLQRLAQHWFNTNSLATINGNSVVITHRDHTDFDFTAWGRRNWKRAADWWNSP